MKEIHYRYDTILLHKNESINQSLDNNDIFFDIPMLLPKSDI